MDDPFLFNNPGKSNEEKGLIEHIINFSVYECSKNSPYHRI